MRINISSVNGTVPQPRCVAYGAAKAAVESMTILLAEDLAPYGIRANCIAPGPIQSHMPDDAPPRQTERVLLGRTGLPSEVATVAVFLASEESSYVINFPPLVPKTSAENYVCDCLGG